MSLEVILQDVREWLSGGVSPCQGEGRGFESRLALYFFRMLPHKVRQFFYAFSAVPGKDDVMRVDLIVPCFNEEQVLPLFWEEAFRMVSEIPDYEFGFLFVDDGSKDRTLAILRGLADEHPEVSYISFSRNFGKEAAMFAALSHTKADYAVILDADLQHPPALIAPMLEAMEEGYDCCTAIRSRKGDPKLRTWFSRKFYQLMNRISDVQLKDGAGDFRWL